MIRYTALLVHLSLLPITVLRVYFGFYARHLITLFRCCCFVYGRFGLKLCLVLWVCSLNHDNNKTYWFLQVILAIIAAKGRLIGFSNVAFKELELSIAMLEKLAPHPILKTRLVSLLQLGFVSSGLPHAMPYSPSLDECGIRRVQFYSAKAVLPRPRKTRIAALRWKNKKNG